jgi:hypothetical protein
MLGHLKGLVTVWIRALMETHRKMAAEMLLQLRVFLKIFVASNHRAAYLNIIDRLLKALVAPQQPRLVNLWQVCVDLCLQ